MTRALWPDTMVSSSFVRRPQRRGWMGITLGLLLAVVLLPGRAGARPTATMPKHTFMLDVAHANSWVRNAYDNHGNKGPLIEPMYRYEPGGGLQGIIIPNARVNFQLIVPQLRYGITDYLTAAFGVPVSLRTKVEPDLGWVPGDYYWPLGRSYTEEDFWQWAQSMGQGKPGVWEGNKGVLSDIVLGLRYRISHLLPAFERAGWGLAVTAYWALPTGTKKDNEELASAGTTSWELHFQGELGFHVTIDKTFRSLADRFTVGLDVFYEVFFEHSYKAGTGAKHPLIQNQAPYVGETYTIDPGDFMGFGVYLEFIPWIGPTTDNWLTRRAADGGASYPPLLTVGLGYIFTYHGQSDWTSNSALWDWTQEKAWRPGYKNRLILDVQLSFMRLGAPFMAYVSLKNLSWIPGRNNRPADVIMTGLRIPFKIW